MSATEPKPTGEQIASAPTAEQSAPRYVTCACQYCDGHIEFDANQLPEVDSISIECPHCHRQTTLPVPEPIQAAVLESQAGGDLKAIVKRAVILLGLEIEPSAVELIARASSGTSADVLRLVRCVRDLAKSCGVTGPIQTSVAVEALEKNATPPPATDGEPTSASLDADPDENGQEGGALALSWFRKAAEQGDAACQFELGQALAGGIGVAKDWVEAAQWFHKSAEQGNTEAQAGLGICYWNGDGVPQNRVEAVEWLRKAADQGHAKGQFALGLAYYLGEGVSKDHAEAARLFHKAAEQGHTDAQYNLSVIYDKGHGVGCDRVEAHKWATLAAAKEDSQAEKQCLELASEINSEELQESLRRVEAFRRAFKPPPKLEVDIMNLARSLASSGDTGVQEWLAYNLKDRLEAAKWLRLLAEQGSFLAQHRLGIAYLTGEGVSQDRVEAVRWFRKAAEQGLVPAQLELGRAYYYGVGVPQNYVEAYRLANIAAARGLDDAVELRDEVAAKMSPKQIAHAQRLSAEKSDRPERQAIPSEVRQEVWRRDGGRCVKCGSRENLEYDHIIPVSKGGSNTARNIELLCENCNRSKSASIQ